MATVVKLRGLDRGKSVVSDGSPTSGSYRGFKVPSALGSSYTGGTSVAASRTIGASNAAVTYTSKIGGAAGNNITVAQVDPTTNNATLSVVVTYASTTGYPTITVNGATDGASALTSTATQVAAAVNADPEASQFVTAAAGGTGALAIVAGGASALTSGANGTGTAEVFYQKVTNKATALVDVDDPKTQRVLKRNANRWVSLGAA